jgi:hypothetical protein
MKKLFLISFLATILFACAVHQQPDDFASIYSRKFLPRQFHVLECAQYTAENNRPRLRCVGAVSAQDGTKRLMLVWAEYGLDRRGNWYRISQKDDGFAYAQSLPEAREIALEHLQLYAR